MNRNIILAVILMGYIFDCLPAKAQLERRHIYVGEMVEIRHDKDVNPSSGFGLSETGYWKTRLNIIPQVGITLTNNFELGIGVGYSTRTEKEKRYMTLNNLETTKLRVNMLMLKLYGRIYRSFSDKFGIYGEFSAGGGKGKKRWQSEDSYAITKANGGTKEIDISAGPGLYFKAGKRVLLDVRFFKASYVRTNETLKQLDGIASKEDITDSKFDISFFKAMTLGFRIVL